MRATATLVALLATALIAPCAEARMAFEDNKLNFRSCDGKNLTARWRDNAFHVSVPGKTLEPAAPELKYMGWDGRCRSLRVGKQGEFLHASDGGQEANHMIGYVSWDDSRWAATRAGTGFFHVFVAGRDGASAGAMHSAAVWLETNKPDSRAAARLAHELAAASNP